MTPRPDDAEIQQWLDDANTDPDTYTPEQVTNLARGRDKNDK